MTELITINHPFHTEEDFSRRVGHRLARLIQRLAGKYPQLSKGCGTKRMLLALSVAWALTGLAKEGDRAAFDHIDEALSPPTLHGCATAPMGGCVVVEGAPFYIAEGEQAVLHFLWDGFTIFIDHEGTARVGQHFFDIADAHQSKAYSAMSEEWDAKDGQSSAAPAAIPAQTGIPAQTAILAAAQVQAVQMAPAPMPMPTPSRLQPIAPPQQVASCTANPPEQPQQASESHCQQAEQASESQAQQAPERHYMAEMVEGVLACGNEQAVRSLLASFGYIAHHDAYIDHLRSVLLHRLEQMAVRQMQPSEMNYHFEGDVGQVIARGDGILKKY